MISAITFVAASLAVCLTNAKLHQFALNYEGSCHKISDTEQQCNGKAVSETFYAYIDNQKGVDFGVRSTGLGMLTYVD